MARSTLTSAVFFYAGKLPSGYQQLTILLVYNGRAEFPVFSSHSLFTENLPAPMDQQSFDQILTNTESSRQRYQTVPALL